MSAGIFPQEGFCFLENSFFSSSWRDRGCCSSWISLLPSAVSKSLPAGSLLIFFFSSSGFCFVVVIFPWVFFFSLISPLVFPEKFSAALQPQTLLDLLQVESQKIEEESEVSSGLKSFGNSRDSPSKTCH